MITERGFSQMKAVRANDWNSLKADTAARLKEAEAFREEEKIVAPESYNRILCFGV
jgi:hypothetical protein